MTWLAISIVALWAARRLARTARRLDALRTVGQTRHLLGPGDEIEHQRWCRCSTCLAISDADSGQEAVGHTYGNCRWSGICRHR